MKRLLIPFLALALCPPVQAQINHTGRYYGPNGSYIKCSVVGGQYSSSTHCISGEAARDEDRRLAAKNACTAKVEAAHEAKWGKGISNKRLVDQYGLEPTYEPIGRFDSAFYETLGQSHLANDVAYAEYRAKTKACFTKNGFN